MFKSDGKATSLGFVEPVGLRGLDGLVDDGVGTDALRSVDGVFAQRERESVDEVGSTPPVSQNVLDAFLDFGLLRDRFDEFCLKEDTRQEVVQVVADPIGNLAKHTGIFAAYVFAELRAQPIQFGPESLDFCLRFAHRVLFNRSVGSTEASERLSGVNRVKSSGIGFPAARYVTSPAHSRRISSWFSRS